MSTFKLKGSGLGQGQDGNCLVVWLCESCYLYYLTPALKSDLYREVRDGIAYYPTAVNVEQFYL